MKTKLSLVIFVIALFSLSGCAYIEKARMADDLEAENANLKNKIALLQKEKVKEVQNVSDEKEKEVSELEQAKKELEESLKKEIGD